MIFDSHEPVEVKPIDAEAVKALVKNDTKKLRLVNLWATWCGPCLIEMPELVTMNRMYRGRDFEMVTISMDDPAKTESVLEALLVPCTEREDLFKRLDSPKALRLVQHPTGQLPPLRGDLLRAMRLRKGLTQAEVARRLGITQGMLAKYGPAPSAEEIDENRREMFRNFAQDF